MDQRVQQAARVNEAVKELDEFDAAADHFLLACEDRFSRVVGNLAGSVTSESYVTKYVIPGREFSLNDGEHCLTFWIGLNGPRIFFITRYIGTPEELKQVFNFSLGGATKVGWHFNFEEVQASIGKIAALEGADDEAAAPAPTETSIWGTVDTNAELTQKRDPRPLDGEPEALEGESADILTSKGCFWVNDIAMMLQSLLRTSQRHNVQNSNVPPAPL